MPTENDKLQIHAHILPETADSNSERAYHDVYIHRKRKKRTSFHDRLLRNSCIACAVLLGVLALSHVDQPWAQKASDRIEKALTMKIDLDQSIGQMSFVQKIMPESALVFFNLSGASDMHKPIEGTLSHAYSVDQPYLIFECKENQSVYMPSDGTVAAVSRLSDGAWGILLDHGNGVESVISGLERLDISAGDMLKQGDALGTCRNKIYFEMRSGGEAVDPTQHLGL